MNWERVAKYLEKAADAKQGDIPGADGKKDEGALLLRTLAAAIRFGLQRS
jgi:hypothetical protein